MPDSETEMKRLEKKPFEVDIKEESKTKIPPKKSRRQNIEIIYSILKACEDGAIETHVLYRANINLAKWKELYGFLVKGGYMREETKDSSTIYTTEKKGRKLIGFLDNLREFTDYNPEIISNDNIKLRLLLQKIPTQKSVPHDVHSERQKPVFYDVYYDQLSTILGELNQTDSKIIKKALITLDKYTPVAGGFSIQVNPNLSVILRRGKSPSIQILVKSNDSISYSIVYSSSDSSPEVWNGLPKGTKGDTIKTLQELEDRSRLIISEKYEEVKAIAPEGLTKTEDSSRQVAPIKFKPEMSYGEQRLLNEAETFLNTKMTRLKHYGEDNVERLLSLFIKEGGNVSQPALDTSSLFNNLRKIGVLREYRLMGRTCYKLREKS